SPFMSRSSVSAMIAETWVCARISRAPAPSTADSTWKLPAFSKASSTKRRDTPSLSTTRMVEGSRSAPAGGLRRAGAAGPKGSADMSHRSALGEREGGGVELRFDPQVRGVEPHAHLGGQAAMRQERRREDRGDPAAARAEGAPGQGDAGAELLHDEAGPGL